MVQQTMEMPCSADLYNGLQVQVNRRYTKGFQYGVVYTWAKTLETVTKDGPADDGDALFGRPYKQFNYGPADFDQAHIFTVNYIWDIPALSQHFGNNHFIKAVFDGWQISGTTSFATGKPKTFGSGTGLNWTYAGTTSATNITDFTGGDVQARPVLTCDPNHQTGKTDPTGTPYLINTSCFAKPGTSGAIGYLPRNVIRLPAIFNTDLALFKNFHFGEKRNLQFRWETYNLFNRSNFTDINGAMTFDANGVQTNTSFGTPRAARSPRVMQGSLRFSF